MKKAKSKISQDIGSIESQSHTNSSPLDIIRQVNQIYTQDSTYLESNDISEEPSELEEEHIENEGKI